MDEPEHILCGAALQDDKEATANAEYSSLPVGKRKAIRSYNSHFEGVALAYSLFPCPVQEVNFNLQNPVWVRA